MPLLMILWTWILSFQVFTSNTAFFSMSSSNASQMKYLLTALDTKSFLQTCGVLISLSMLIYFSLSTLILSLSVHRTFAPRSSRVAPRPGSRSIMLRKSTQEMVLTVQNYRVPVRTPASGVCSQSAWLVIRS